MPDLKRREFITLLGGAAAWPLAARAQQSISPVVAFLNSTSEDAYASEVAAFRRGLQEAGFIERQNVAIEYRWANGRYERLPDMAADLVRLNVAVIVANGPAVAPAKAATSTVPIVFSAGFDPVEAGLVASLNRPGGNLTGVSILNVEIGQKRLQLLHEIVPAARTVGVLINPGSPSTEALSHELQSAGRALGIELQLLEAKNEREIEAAFAEVVRLHCGALLIGNDTFFTSQARRLAQLAVRHSVPASYAYRDFVAAGGLMSYGASLADVYRQAGIYAGRILKGEKSADLPVVQSTKVDLIINMKTATALGLTIPLPIIGRADEVIE
jgi:putative ABC transport system substrate-binding protein